MSDIDSVRPGRGIGYRLLMFLLCAAVLAPIQGLSAEKLQEPVAKVNGTVHTTANLEEASNAIIPAWVFHGG